MKVFSTLVLVPLMGSLALTRAAAIIPGAIVVDPSQFWDGNDGPWSSFPIRVGTPEQDVRLFPSTAATSTWVIQAPLGCEGWEGTSSASDCASYRGGNFTNATSSTWTDKGVYFLFVEQNLGYEVQGDYGFDNVGLGYQGTGVDLNSSLVTLITSPDFIIGSLGLNPRDTNFTTSDHATSLLSLLYEQNKIPSLSFSYNAGAQYRLNGVLGSLILGGYDDSLYEPNDLTFDFYFDQTRDLTVGLQAITSTTSSGNTALLPTPDLYLIDSTIAQNYLAQDACEAFEKAFNLTLDNTTGLYLLDDAQHAHLLELNPNVTFTLGAEKSGGSTVNITFPYAAFDLNVSYPITQNATRYFPIVQAVNSTQYTLGRQFLQEAYITIDYQRQNFSVYQRTWSLNTDTHIVSITPPNSTDLSTTSGSSPTDTSDSEQSSGIGTGAIVGIVIGVVAIIALIGGLLFFLRRQRKRKAAEKEAAAVAAAIENDQKDPVLPQDPYSSGPSDAIGELDSPPIKPPELHAEHYFTGAEMDSSQIVPTPEMEGDRVFYELEAPHGMHELTTSRVGATERQASDASNTPTWKSRSPIRHPSDGGG
ncbi:hypothetical protein D0Z07_7797 [Hyphodiscus hymeniophilus]|uniref:Peptidase A1 domain-containing protein n=1 Tax=Hyphodiscus hymeniophilus TaxID=353542 RepID=A0A9P6SQE0_9HELO|nr:hypothetical protein D0Z07_7797 [Hyphodiscus hymeniophilus]